jgi:hypothetical protein
MKNLLQFLLVFALINFSGGQQILQALHKTCTSEIQSRITASFVEEEIHEPEDSSSIDEDETEKEFIPFPDVREHTAVNLTAFLFQAAFLIPDSQAEDHNPPPESVI